MGENKYIVATVQKFEKFCYSHVISDSSLLCFCNCCRNSSADEPVHLMFNVCADLAPQNKKVKTLHSKQNSRIPDILYGKALCFLTADSSLYLSVTDNRPKHAVVSGVIHQSLDSSKPSSGLISEKMEFDAYTCPFF